MTTIAILDGLSASDLYGELPTSVSATVKAMDENGADWNIIGASLALSPTAGVALKGGGAWRQDLWAAVKSEFAEFLCSGSPKYDELRTEWSGLKDKSKHIAIASLSGAIGAQLGVAAGVVAPLVVWLIIVALKIGKEGLCRTLITSAPNT